MTEVDVDPNKTTIIDEEFHCELNFHSLSAEGTNLKRQGDFKKAIDAFTKVKFFIKKKNKLIINNKNNDNHHHKRLILLCKIITNSNNLLINCFIIKTKKNIYIYIFIIK